MKPKNLPIGVQAFSSMIEGNYIYVDKTKYILNLIMTGECYFLSRPRRFGKSLLISTLYEIFSGNRGLFKSFYIDTTDYSWPEHPIIHFSFSSMNVENSESLKKDIEWNLFNHAAKYNLSIEDAPSLQTKFSALVERLAQRGKVVILVDEYDFPLINNINKPGMAEECRKVLHDFFVVLKDLGKYLRFIFITGVSRFSKTSIFSGLNNLNDISLSEKGAELLGYTEEEIKNRFDDYLNLFAKRQKTSKKEILNTIQKWYNGYQFVEDENSPKKVYNPFSVLLALENKKFMNYWAETGTPTFIAHLIKNQNFPISEIDGSEVNYLETRSYEIDKIKLIPLLWQTGYLTIKSYDQETQNYKLTFPNKEVSDSFFTFILSDLKKKIVLVGVHFDSESRNIKNWISKSY